MLRDVDCHIPALCKVIRNHTYQQVTWRSASFSTQQSGEEPILITFILPTSFNFGALDDHKSRLIRTND